MDVAERMDAWWASLTVEERAEAVHTTDEIPAWMLVTLDCHRIPTITANVDGRGQTPLMTIHLREFIERHHQNH